MAKAGRRGAVPAHQSASQQPGPRAELAQLLAAGVRHHQAGQLQQADALYREVLRRDPDHADALHLLGQIALQTNNLAVASGLIERAVELKPRSALFQCSLGATLRAQGRTEAAIERYQRAIKLEPARVEAHYNLALILKQAGQYDAAIRHYDRALALQPDHAEAHNNLGVVLHQVGRLEEAVGHYRRALARKADYVEAHFNLGNWHKDSGELQEAIAIYERGLALMPDSPGARANLGMMRLVLGDFERGWDGYEHRARHGGRNVEQDGRARTLWQGEPIAGKTILLHAEQGFGDTLQFVRFAPLVAARGARVVLEVQAELKSLLARCAGAQHVVTRGEAGPAFDLHCPLPSLPRALAVRLDGIPADVPYVYPDAARVEHWRGRLVRDGTLRVGLVWAGNPGHQNDRNRSMPYAALRPLLDVPGVSFHSLQVGAAAAEPAADPRLVRLDGELRDFDDTAAVLAHLDLVIAVDTAIVHLAGAMGRNAWCLLPTAPDWRWLLGREDSPWYPTVRLFRQTQRGNWVELVERVRAQLAALAAR